MKIIIDIPKSEYMEIKRYYDSLPEYSTVEAETYYIAHGTPLDDLRADLHATAEMHSDGDYYLRDEWIDEYFDDIGKESEET